jgi:hypothetical protein
MRRGRPNKRAAQMRHAKRRANERYGLHLNDNDLLAITRMIQHGEGTFVERMSIRVALWDLVWQGVPVRIAYDSERHTPVTFLHRDKRDHDESCGITAPGGNPAQPFIHMSDAMSLYNAVMGENPAANDLLKMLGLDKTGIPRYRDCWLSADRKYIHLLTRTGGGNRAEYLDEIDALRRIAWFEYDHDDEADPTFMHFVYTLPSKSIATPIAGNDVERGPAFMMKAIEALKDHGLSEPHPNAKLEAIRQGAVAVSRKIVDAIGASPSGTIIRVADDGRVSQTKPRQDTD